MGTLDEESWLAWLRQRLPPAAFPVTLGIGDDVAVLQDVDRLAVAADMLLDGVHFDLASCRPQDAGRKALGVNLSDLAAMGARPQAAFVSVAFPERLSASSAEAAYEGMIELAEQFEVTLAGGDTNVWPGPLVLSVTVCGRCPGSPWRRDGARPGDRLLATGALGGSLAGRHLTFTPRVAEALRLREARAEIHAAIDVSDGLALDLSRLARASGCGAVLDLDRVPIHDDARCCKGDPLERALSDGEDFELLLAVPPEEARRLIDGRVLGATPLRDVGHLVEELGLWAQGESGRQPLEPRGFVHGRPAEPR